jgi:hypothetical protein
MQVDPARSPSKPQLENERLSAAMSDPAFAYAFYQNSGLLPPNWEGDNATIDAIYTIAKGYKSPPATPVLSSLSPNTMPAGSPTFLMTITGTGFTPGATVIFGTVTEPRVTFISPTSLTVWIYKSYIPLAGTIQVSVLPGGGAAASNQLPFTVT